MRFVPALSARRPGTGVVRVEQSAAGYDRESSVEARRGIDGLGGPGATVAFSFPRSLHRSAIQTVYRSAGGYLRGISPHPSLFVTAWPASSTSSIGRRIF